MKLLYGLYQTGGKWFITIPVLFLAMNLAFTARAQDKNSDQKQKIHEAMNNANDE